MDTSPDGHGQESDSMLVETRIQGEVYLMPKRYRIDGVIGRGAYGEVCQGFDTTQGIPVAIKKNKRIFQQANSNSLIPIRVLRELKVLCHLHHPNIVNLSAVIIPESYEEFNDIYMVMELMQADLRDLLVTGQKLSDKHVQYITYQILLALAYIHSADILHRDLKPENILLNADCVLKLCDFGLARGIDFEKDPRMSTNYVQTRYYRAPELLLNNATVTKQVDMWSVGCIMAELLGGKILFQGTSPINQIEKIVRIVGTPKNLDFCKGSPQGVTFMKQLRKCDPVPLEHLFDPDTNRDAIDLLGLMLAFDPDERISAAEALKHPYFADILNEAEVLEAAKKFDFSFEKHCDTLEGIKQEAFHTILEFNGIIRRVGSIDEDDFEVLTPIGSMEEQSTSPLVHNEHSPIGSSLKKTKSSSGLKQRLSSHDIKSLSGKDLSRYNSFETSRGTINVPHGGFDPTIEKRRSQILKEQAQKELLTKIMDEPSDDSNKKKKGGLFQRMKSFMTRK